MSSLEETHITRQWEVKSIKPDIKVDYTWGLTPDNVQEVFRLFVEKGDPIKDRKITFRQLQVLVSHLHQSGIDTEDLNKAVSQLKKKETPLTTKEFKDIVKKIYAERIPTVEEDPQKNRWGGLSKNNGMELSAKVKPAIMPGWFDIQLSVSVIAEKTFTGNVAFFLHDTFNNDIIYTTPKGGIASINLDPAHEAFTVGAYIEDGTILELDMDEVPGYPVNFYSGKVSAEFRKKVAEMESKRKVLIPDDRQKGRWGGVAKSKGKVLSAAVSKLALNQYTVKITVSSNNPDIPLNEDVAIFLHESFSKTIKYRKAVNGAVRLNVVANEAFTIGAYIEDGTILELDLNTVKDYPKDFYYVDELPRPRQLVPYASFSNKAANAIMENVKKRLENLLNDPKNQIPQPADRKKVRCPLVITETGDIKLTIPGKYQQDFPSFNNLTSTFPLQDHDLFFNRLRNVIRWMDLYNYHYSKDNRLKNEYMITLFCNQIQGKEYIEDTSLRIPKPHVINTFLYLIRDGIFHPEIGISIKNKGKEKLYFTPIYLKSDYSIDAFYINKEEIEPGEDKLITFGRTADHPVNRLMKLPNHEGSVIAYIRFFISRNPIDISSFNINNINEIQEPVKIPLNLLAVETIGLRIIKPLFEI